MKIEGLAGHAQNAHALAREGAPARPGRESGGDEAAPSVVVDITDAADQPLATRGRSAQSPAHQARALMESYREMGAELGDLRFGQIVSRIARGLDASELFVLPEPPVEKEVSKAIEATDEGEATPTVEAEETPSAVVDPDLAVASLLLEETTEETETPDLVAAPPAEEEAAV